MSLDLYWRGWLTTNKGECNMAKAKSTSTSIKAKLGLKDVADGIVVTALTASYNGVLNNPAYPALPFDLASYKAGIDKFSALVVDAEDGGKKAVSAKNKQREVVIKMYTLLGHYVCRGCVQWRSGGLHHQRFHAGCKAGKDSAGAVD
jgi:hypothetical protein